MTLLSNEGPPYRTPKSEYPDQLNKRRRNRDLAVCDTARFEGQRQRVPTSGETTDTANSTGPSAVVDRNPRIPRPLLQPNSVSRSLLIASAAAAAAAAASTSATSARTGKQTTRDVRTSCFDKDIRKYSDGRETPRFVSEIGDKQSKQQSTTSKPEVDIQTPPSKKLSTVERRTSPPSTTFRTQKRIFIDLDSTDHDKAGATSPRKKPQGDACGEAKGIDNALENQKDENSFSPSSISTRNEPIRPPMRTQLGNPSDVPADAQTPSPQPAEDQIFRLFRDKPAQCLGAGGYMSTVARELHRQVVEFTELLAFSPIEQRVRELVLYHVEDAIQTVFPNAEVKAFGSSQTRLSLPTSDIDITVRVSEDDDRSAVQNYLRHLERGIKAAGCATWVKRINGARIPILKFDEMHTGIPIDISVNQTSGHEAIPFVLDMLKRHPAARPLTLLVKQILATVGLNDVSMGGMGSYAVFLLVISFLELHPLIKSGTIDPEKSLGVIFLELMEFFGRKFDYQSLAIRIAGGVTFCRKSQLGFANGTPKLCIQDPLQPNNDIAKGTSQIASICHVFATVYERIITAATSLNDPQIFNAKRLSSDAHFPLSGILSISPMMLARRSAVYHAFYSGYLHHAVGLPAEDERMLVDGREWPVPPRRSHYLGNVNASNVVTGDRRRKAFQYSDYRDVNDTKSQTLYSDATIGTAIGATSLREPLTIPRHSLPTAPPNNPFRQLQQSSNDCKLPPPLGIRFRGHPYPLRPRFPGPGPEPGHRHGIATGISNPASGLGFSMGVFHRPSSFAQNDVNGHSSGRNDGGSVMQPWGHSLARTEGSRGKAWRQ